MNTTNTGTETETLEEEVRKAVEGGLDVRDKVRQVTLRIMRERSFDIDSLRQTVTAVLRGARAGAQSRLGEPADDQDKARGSLREAVSGLDAALAQFAEAAKLAVEEARGKAETYSREDLARARADLEKLEKMYVESLQQAASAAKGTAGEILSDLASHARINGSAVGRQMKDTVSSIAREIGAAGSARLDAGLHLARDTADHMRKLAAEALNSLADRVHPGGAGEKDK
ncbi:MAG TPA: DUF6781 family protein [Gallionellaceae bacterium]|nr:DUF6781 family protein [Gallionellaceae bacterium]